MTRRKPTVAVPTNGSTSAQCYLRAWSAFAQVEAVTPSDLADLATITRGAALSFLTTWERDGLAVRLDQGTAIAPYKVRFGRPAEQQTSRTENAA